MIKGWNEKGYGVAWPREEGARPRGKESMDGEFERRECV